MSYEDKVERLLEKIAYTSGGSDYIHSKKVIQFNSTANKGKYWADEEKKNFWGLNALPPALKSKYRNKIKTKLFEKDTEGLGRDTWEVSLDVSTKDIDKYLDDPKLIKKIKDLIKYDGGVKQYLKYKKTGKTGSPWHDDPNYKF